MAFQQLKNKLHDNELKKVKEFCKKCIINPNIFKTQNRLEKTTLPRLKTFLEKYKTKKEKTLPSLEKALRRAAALNKIKDVELLLAYGAQIDNQDKNPKSRKTALHWAAIKEYSEIQELLLNYGACEDITDGESKKPEDYTSKNNCNYLVTGH